MCKNVIQFRKFLYDNKCNREYSFVINNILFKSEKYINDKLIGIFFLNVSEQDITIDDIIVP